MIHINLLPVRAAKKKETVRQQVSIMVFSMVGVLLISLAFYGLLLIKISSTKEEISRADSELNQLKTKIGEIDNLKKVKEEVQKKLNVLNQLRKEKTGPARRLATLSDITPEKLWLTKYTEKDADVSISGVAVSEDLIATFMRNLEASEDYSNIQLLVSEQADIAGTKGKKFDISCKLKGFIKFEQPKPAASTPPPAKK